MGSEEKSKILIFGATGYLGNFMVRASLSMSHPTYAYVRPIKPNSDPSKLLLHHHFQSLGVILFQRFVPSEFGNDVNRISGLPPFQAVLDNKRKIRMATEAAGIPYTYVSANSFAAYFVDILLHPGQKNRDDEVTIYGSGEAKAVLNYEEDVAAYTVRAATDGRASNGVVFCRPQRNIVSQLDLLSSWEKKTARSFKTTHVPEEYIIKLSQTLPPPDNIQMAILHNIFIKGDQMSFELTEEDLEASKLYPDYKYTSVDDLLDICLVNPPKPKLTSLCA